MWRVERRRDCSIGPLRVEAHFGMPRGEKMSLALYEPKQVALHSNSSTIPSMHHHKYKDSIDCMQNPPMEIHRGPTPDGNVPFS